MKPETRAEWVLIGKLAIVALILLIIVAPGLGESPYNAF